MTIDYITHINPSKDSWIIIVRLIRLWHVSFYNELQSIETVLIDENVSIYDLLSIIICIHLIEFYSTLMYSLVYVIFQCDKIQASIKRSMIHKFRYLINQGESK